MTTEIFVPPSTTPQQRRWQTLPASYRAHEAEQVADWIAQGESGSVLGLPGVGRSTFLNFLCHRPDALKQYLPPHRTAVLVPIDLNNLPNNRLDTLYRVILRSFFENRGQFAETYQKLIATLYRKHETARDPFLPQSGLRELLQQLEADGQQTVLLLNRFDYFCQKATPQMTLTLRGLRDSFKDSLSLIIGMHHEIVYLSHLPSLEPLRGILDTFVCWLGPLDEVDSQGMMERQVEKEVKTAVSTQIHTLTGGNSSLIRIVAHLWEQGEDIGETAVLLKKPNIHHRLQKLWQYLSQDEQLVLSELQKLRVKRRPRNQTNQFYKQHEQVLAQLGQKGICHFQKNHWNINGALLADYIATAAGISRGKLWHDSETKQIYQGNTLIPQLQPQAQAVLTFMLENPRAPLTQDDIIEGAWPPDIQREGISTESLYTAIAAIRRAIEPNSRKPRYLITRRQRGGGYQLFPEGRPIT